MTHTPTPWQVTKRYPNYIVINTPRTNLEVAKLRGENKSSNAHFIVRAANAHDALVKALTEILPPKPQEDWICHKGITTMDKCGNCIRINNGYAALAKAQGDK